MPVQVSGKTAAFGLQQTRSRNVNAALAYLLSVGMIGLSLFRIHSSFGMEPAPVAIWAAGLLVVTGIRFSYFRDERVTFTRASRSFFIPGSSIPLFVIVAIFITKYAFAIMRALHAEMAGTDAFIAAFSLAYGCYSGYFRPEPPTWSTQPKVPNKGVRPKPRPKGNTTRSTRPCGARL